jgi:ABC-type branched-subunit amino acid transport system substrate-binding protein
MRGVKLQMRAVAVLCALAALLVGGCGSKQLADHTIYLEVPLSGPLAHRGADMAHAVALGLKQANYDTKTTKLTLRVIDSQNGLEISRAARDPKAIAVIGGLSIEAVRAAAPSDKASGLLQVALAPAPSDATGAAARTANVIWQLPSAFGEGDALAQYIAGLGQREIGFFSDGTAFARALRPGFEAGVARSGMKLLSTFQASVGGKASVVGAGSRSGFVQADDPANPSPPNPHTLVTAGMTADSYPPAGERFYKTFAQQFGHEPDRFAIYAYEATGFVLDAIERVEQAGAAATRASVTGQAFKITDRFGPVGHYDVLPSGRTTLYIFQARGGDAPTGPASLIEAQR